MNNNFSLVASCQNVITVIGRPCDELQYRHWSRQVRSIWEPIEHRFWIFVSHTSRLPIRIPFVGLGRSELGLRGFMDGPIAFVGHFGCDASELLGNCDYPGSSKL